MNYRVRPTKVEEVCLLQEIEIDAAQLYLTAPGHEFCAELGVRGKDDHVRAMREGASLVTVGPDDRPVGFALVIPLDGCAHLLELAVALRSQKQGVGRALLEAVEHWAIMNGFEEVSLTTYRDVPCAHLPPVRLYGLRSAIASDRAEGDSIIRAGQQSGPSSSCGDA